MKDNNVAFSELKSRITRNYRRIRTIMLKKEKRWLDVPTSELELEIAEFRGYLRGMNFIITSIEEAQADNEFPIELGLQKSG